jgi:DNA-binding response OmpR family regulator
MNTTARSRPNILLVEDDPAFATMLKDTLGVRGYCVWHAGTAVEAEVMADEVRPDLIIVDLMLPDTHGLVLCANLREKQPAPIIICSATKRKDDPVLGLKLGADDFIAKPFSVDELQARVEAALRRASLGTGTPAPPEEASERIGQLVIDKPRCQVRLGGREIGLTPTEYRLLCALASRPDHVLSREELAERVWGHYDPGIGRSLDVHLRRLRAKLNTGPVPPPALLTVRGFGYQLAREPRPEIAAVGA